MVKLICASKKQTDFYLERKELGKEGDHKYMAMSRCVSNIAKYRQYGIMHYLFEMSSFYSGQCRRVV